MEVRSVEAIIRALNLAETKYLIVGGLAINAHGYERLTRDVDIVIGLEPENITRGLRALLEIGYHMAIPVSPEEFADPAARETWRTEKDMVVLKLGAIFTGELQWTFSFTSHSIFPVSSPPLSGAMWRQACGRRWSAAKPLLR